VSCRGRRRADARLIAAIKNAPQKVADVIYKFYADKGYTMSLDAFSKALSRVEVNPGFPRDLEPYMQQQA